MLGFIYKSKISKTCLLLLQLTVFLPVFGLEQAPDKETQASGPETQSTSPDAQSLDQLFSLEDFSGLDADMEDEQQKEFDSKQAKLDKLPQTLKEAYNTANQKYLIFLKKIDIKNGLKDLCNEIKSKLDVFADKLQNPDFSSNAKQVKAVLDKFDEALFAGTFKQIPAIPKTVQKNFFATLLERLKAGNAKKASENPDAAKPDDANKEFDGLANFQLNFDENGGKAKDESQEAAEQKCKFDENDFDELFDSFKKIFPAIKEAEDVELLSAILSFRNIVITLQNDNNTELVKRYIRYIAPFQKEATTALIEIKKLFNQTLAPIRQANNQSFDAGETNPELESQAELYKYWLSEVGKELENISTFEKLKASSNSVIGQSGWLFDKVGFVYDLSKPILKFYLKSKFENHGPTRRAFELGACEFGINIAFACWIQKIRNLQKSKPKLESHLLHGSAFGKTESPMDMISRMMSSMTSGTGGMEDMLESMVLGMMNGATDPWEKRIMKGGLFLLNFKSALDIASAPKGLSLVLIKCLRNYPQFWQTSQDLKDIATEAVFQYLKAGYHGRWSKNLPHELKDKLRLSGIDIVTSSCDLVSKKIDQLLPSFWENCDKFTLGIVNPDILRTLAPKIFNIYAYSSGWMNDSGYDDETLGSWINSIKSNNQEARQTAFNNLAKYVDDEYYQGLFAKASKNNVEATNALVEISELPFGVDLEIKQLLKQAADKDDANTRRAALATLYKKFMDNVSNLFGQAQAQGSKIAKLESQMEALPGNAAEDMSEFSKQMSRLHTEMDELNSQILSLRYDPHALRFKQWFEDANRGDESAMNQLAIKSHLFDDATLERYKRFKADRENHKVGNFQSYLVESMVVSYIVSCFGTKLAEITVKQFRKPLFGAAFKFFDYTVDKMVSIGYRLNLISETDKDDWSSFRNDVESMFDQVPQMIHKFLSICSSNEQGPNMLASLQGGDMPSMMCGLLFKQYVWSYAGILPGESQEVIERKVVIGFLRMLTVGIRLLKYSDGHALMKMFDAKTQLAKTIMSIKESEINEEFIVDFTCKLAKFNVDLANAFTAMLKNKDITTKTALAKILPRLDVEFAKELAEKIKVGIFASAVGTMIFVPLLKNTVGNWIQDQGTLCDGYEWVKSKAMAAKNW